MFKNRQSKLIFSFLLISIIAFTINEASYRKIHNLVEVDELNVVTTHYGDFTIDASENATRILVNDGGYVVDNNELFEILSRYKGKKSRIKYSPYSGDDIVAKISFLTNNGSRHILLGNFNIWYEPGERAYEIIDGDELLNEILLLVNNK